jgi:hypothetical protein
MTMTGGWVSVSVDVEGTTAAEVSDRSLAYPTLRSTVPFGS